MSALTPKADIDLLSLVTHGSPIFVSFVETAPRPYFKKVY